MTFITLASVFTDNLVLQRQRKIPVWGEGRDGICVEVKLSSERAGTVVKNGRWSVSLPAMEASCGLQLTVTAKDEKTEQEQEIRIANVAVGEVWIASGQSNMEFLYRYDIERIREEETPEDEMFRFFDVPKVSYEGQLEAGHYEDYGFWRCLNGKNAEWFSAVGYYFGRILRQELQVPVGIIGCNWGGCNAATWTSPERMREYEETRGVIEEYQNGLKKIDMNAYIRATDYMTAKDPSESRIMTDLLLSGAGFQEIEAKRRSLQTREDEEYSMTSMQVGPRSFRRPSGLYENMLKKILPCEIRGVLWYQGEEDEIARSEFYDVSLTALIKTFRDQWENLPFLLVQLPPFEGHALALARKYPIIRRMQQKVSETVPGVWCACTTDAGERNNIHPRRKRPVGERLGFLALKHVYQKNIEADSPKLIKMEKEGDTISLYFINTADGLRTTEGKVKGLEIYAQGFRLFPDIRVEKDRIILTDESLCSVMDQITVRYAADNYFEVNLYNSAGLPVFPFEMTWEKTDKDERRQHGS